MDGEGTLPDDVDYGRHMRVDVDHETRTGQIGTTAYATTDGSAPRLRNDHIVAATVEKSRVDASTAPWPCTGTTAANGWRVFHGDFTIAPDTTTSNGWVTVTPSDGSTLDVDVVATRPPVGVGLRERNRQPELRRRWDH
ncbi:hypothetical protein ACWD0Z_36145 [Streptomyces sp. NPDC003007]